MSFEALFEPFRIGTMELRNRIVLSPMGTSLSKGFQPTERSAAYYAARAKGTAGLIILEHTYPQEMGCKTEKSLGLWSEEMVPAWTYLVDEIHKAGGKVAVEIGHLGRCTDYSRIIGQEAISPSSVRCPVSQEKTRSVTKADIEQFKKDYLNSVRLAVKAGVDAIELHFTNGYFIASWLSGRTNKRMDEYGGNLENRMRFPLELYHMVREEVGEDFPILARLAAREPNGGRGIEETRVIAKVLEEVGVDALDINAGSPSDFDWEFPSYFKEQGFLLEDIERIKKAVSIPVIGGGRIVEPRMAEQALKDGRVDLVSIGREQIADPNWGEKARTGDLRSIRRCIACTRCIHGKEANGLICTVNPFVGREKEWVVTPTQQPKKVLVVGGGPAGLQAASTLAQRGHDVTLAEKAREFGGMVRAACVPPKKWEIGGIINTLVYEAEQNGAKLLTDTFVTADYVRQGGFQAVILANGTESIVPKFIPVHGELQAATATDVLLGEEWVGQKVALIGGGLVGCETAEFIAEYKKKVVVFEMLDKIAGDAEWNIRDNILARLEQLKVDTVTGAKVQDITDGVVRYEKDGVIYEEKGFDTVVWAIGRKGDLSLADALKADGIETIVLGDAKKLSRIHEALVDAVQAAINI